MSDWIDSLDPAERSSWDEFVEHFRRDTLQKIAGSAVFVSLLPDDGFDVKFATELGAAIMLNKPIIAVAHPDAVVPEALRSLAERVVCADVDTEEGRERIMAAIADSEAGRG